MCAKAQIHHVHKHLQQTTDSVTRTAYFTTGHWTKAKPERGGKEQPIDPLSTNFKLCANLCSKADESNVCYMHFIFKTLHVPKSACGHSSTLNSTGGLRVLPRPKPWWGDRQNPPL